MLARSLSTGLLAVVLAAGLNAQAPPPAKIEFNCTAEDMQTAGLSCTEDEPCPVYLELSAVEAVNTRLVVAGNLHTASVTLYSILLTSDDGGKTWTEPAPRTRFASLDTIQFIDFENGWIGGEVLFPTPRDIFLLLTRDGGKTWRRTVLFEDGRTGSLSQFWFDSKTNGKLVVDRGRGVEGGRYELYESMTGGEGWEVRQATSTPIRLKQGTARDTGWRLRADAPSKTYRVENRQGAQWEVVASFPVQVGVCKPEAPAADR